jgi:hypothetical protein
LALPFKQMHKHCSPSGGASQMERRGWPSCLRDDLMVMVMISKAGGLISLPGSSSRYWTFNSPRTWTCARLNNALHRSATNQKPGRLPCRVDSTLCISTTWYVPHAPPSRRAWSWSAAERPNPNLEPAPRTKAAARLDLEVSVGWASPSSRGLLRWRHSAAQGPFSVAFQTLLVPSATFSTRGPYA